MIDVTNPPNPYVGADPTGAVDATPKLQAMINDNLGALYFPSGTYRLNSTLVFPPETGHHVVGCGMAQKSGTAGARSVLFWGGSNGGTMVECQGTGLIWNGLTLWGRQTTSGDRAGIGIRICNSCASSSSSVFQLDEAGKFWFPAIMIDDCTTGIKAEGFLPADSCSVGYAWIRGCDTCVQLSGANATMFTFRFLHPLSSKTIFKATGGGRIYVHAINIVEGPTVVLDVQGGDMNNSFFHIGGLKSDAGNLVFHLLKNVDPGNGTTVVRFTDAHFVKPTNSNNVVEVEIDRTGGTGQTVMELIGCKGLTEGNLVLREKVVIKGASSSKKSRLIVRDSELDRDTLLVKETSSSHWTDNRIKNWLFGTGVEEDISRSG